MTRHYDVVGAGVAAVDDLIYVSEYPPADCKVPVSRSTRQGGGPACTAIATVGTLGGTAAYVARFGDNELSNYIASSLRRRAVDISHIVKDEKGGPYHSVIVVDREGRRNVFYDPVLYHTITTEDLSEALIRSANLVLLDHITEPCLTAVAAKVREFGVPILVDIEGRTDSAMKLAELADYLVVPKSFACWATEEADPSAACSALARSRRRATVVTDGSNGCYLSTEREQPVRHFSAFQIDAFDTNGCGDTFHGALALTLSRNVAIEHGITFASAAAALKAMAGQGRRRGWDAIPALDEVYDFLQAKLGEQVKSALLRQLQVLREPLAVAQ